MRKINLINLIILIILVGAKPVQALDRMESSSYKIRFPNLNMTSGNKSSDNYNILDTVGQTAPGEYQSSGFYVKAGFPYIKTIVPFTFSISNLSLNFGSLTPSTFSSLNNTLTVTFGASGGYSVTAIANHPLQLAGSGMPIPDTTCDTACDESTADSWTNTAKYGFGYNVSGDDKPAEFTGATIFKQFSDASLGESPEIVMSSNNVGTGRVATITYKINISAAQAAGDYENAITYAATPSY